MAYTAHYDPDYADQMLRIFVPVPPDNGPRTGEIWRSRTKWTEVRVTCVTATRVHGTFVDTEIGWDWPIGSFSRNYEKAL
jgi:hypothetical protein